MSRRLGVSLVGVSAPGYRSLALDYLHATVAADPRLDVAVNRLDTDTAQDPWWLAYRLLSLEPAPDVIALPVYCWTARHVFEAVRLVKSELPNVLVVVGGPEVGPIAEEVLASHSAIDAVVRGEGEFAFAELLHSHARGGDIASVPGVTARAGAAIVSAPDRDAIANLDDVPSPFSTGRTIATDGSAYVETYRGCPHACAYCYEGKGSTRIRSFSWERIAADIEAVASTPGMRSFSFIDPVFNLTPDRLARLSELLAPHARRGVRLHTIEVDIERIDDEQAALLAAAGVASVETGPQSVGAASLAACARSFDAEAFAAGVEACKRVGISVECDLIVGLPGDSVGRRRRRARFRDRPRPGARPGLDAARVARHRSSGSAQTSSVCASIASRRTRSSRRGTWATLICAASRCSAVRQPKPTEPASPSPQGAPKMTVSKRAQAIRPFVVMDVVARAKELEADGRDIVRLEIGDPDFPTPEVIARAGEAAIEEGSTHYTQSLGLPDLREALEAHYRAKYGVAVDPGRHRGDPGHEPGDAAALRRSARPGRRGHHARPLLPRVSELRRVPRRRGQDAAGPRRGRLPLSARRAPCGHRAAHQGDHDQLAEQPDRRGTERDDLAGLARIAEETGVYIASDEIYHGLNFCGPDRRILQHTDRAFVLNGFSKAYAMTGWRLGYLIAPREFVRPAEKIQQNFFLAANAFVQQAGVVALTEAQGDVAHMRAVYDERRRYLVPALRDAGLRIDCEPCGAFYVFADARCWSEDSLALAGRLLEEAGVACAPGIDFGEGARASCGSATPPRSSGCTRESSG